MSTLGADQNPICCQCQKEITEKNFLQSDALALHEGCLAAWEEAHKEPQEPSSYGTCVHCHKDITDRNFLEKNEELRLHKACSEAFFKTVDARTWGQEQEKKKAPPPPAPAAPKPEVVPEKPPMVCGQCKKNIEEKEYLKDGDITLHVACKEPYLEAKNGKPQPCPHCTKLVTGAYVELSSLPGQRLHEECVEPYKRATRPKCKKCGDVIMENKYMKDSSGGFYHEGCTA